MLLRQRLGVDDAYLIGQLTSTGTVRAARGWDQPSQTFELSLPLAGSVEELLHASVGVSRLPDFGLLLRSNSSAPGEGPTAELLDAISHPLLQRAVGVQYQKHTERRSHYFQVAKLAKQFDFLLYSDVTTALEPIRTDHSIAPKRPGTTDYQKWEAWAADQEETNDD